MLRCPLQTDPLIVPQTPKDCGSVAQYPHCEDELELELDPAAAALDLTLPKPKKVEHPTHCSR